MEAITWVRCASGKAHIVDLQSAFTSQVSDQKLPRLVLRMKDNFNYNREDGKVVYIRIIRIMSSKAIRGAEISGGTNSTKTKRG